MSHKKIARTLYGEEEGYIWCFIGLEKAYKKVPGGFVEVFGD